MPIGGANFMRQLFLRHPKGPISVLGFSQPQDHQILSNFRKQYWILWLEKEKHLIPLQLTEKIP